MSTLRIRTMRTGDGQEVLGCGESEQVTMQVRYASYLGKYSSLTHMAHVSGRQSRYYPMLCRGTSAHSSSCLALCLVHDYHTTYLVHDMRSVLHELQQGACRCNQLSSFQALTERAQLCLHRCSHISHAVLRHHTMLDLLSSLHVQAQMTEQPYLHFLQGSLKLYHSCLHIHQLGAEVHKVVVVLVDYLKQLHARLFSHQPCSRATLHVACPTMSTLALRRPSWASSSCPSASNGTCTSGCGKDSRTACSWGLIRAVLCFSCSQSVACRGLLHLHRTQVPERGPT